MLLSILYLVVTIAFFVLIQVSVARHDRALHADDQDMRDASWNGSAP